MNKYLKQSLLFALFLNSTGHALHNPVQGFYGGILAEISHGPTHNSIAFALPETGTYTVVGTVTNSVVGGGAGGMLGYKFQHFRVEGELLYNRFSTGPIRFPTCTIENVNLFSASEGCPNLVTDPDLGFRGSSVATFGFVNGYYDFFTLDNDYNIVPYLGLGFGKAQIKNLTEFATTTPFLVGTTLKAPEIQFNATASSTAIQGILGVSYYMDDFAWLSLDYRYITTKKITLANQNPGYQIQSANLFNSAYTLSTINFTVNFAFDIGGINC